MLPRGGLDGNGCLAGDHMSVQDLQAIRPEDACHRVFCAPGFRTTLHHLTADIQCIFHQVFQLRPGQGRRLGLLIGSHMLPSFRLLCPKGTNLDALIFAHLTAIHWELQETKPTESHATPTDFLGVAPGNSSIDEVSHVLYNEFENGGKSKL